MPVQPKKVVSQLEPYKGPDEGRHGCVRLDFNENTSGFPEAYPAGLPPSLISAYPEYGTLISRIADHYEVDSSCLMLSNGSDEALMVIANTFIEPGQDNAVISQPCFVVFPHCLKLAGANLITAPAKPDLSFDTPAIEAVLKSGCKIAMFASPENPTGAVLDAQLVEKWCQNFRETLFVIDEAYGEYADGSLLPVVKQVDNLLVLKTFSKAWGMAGLRLGITFGHPRLIADLLKVRLPYSVNSAAVWTAERLLDCHSLVKQSVEAAKQEKVRMCASLQEKGYRIDAGHANSILLSAGLNAGRLTEFCKQAGVLIRNRSHSQFPLDPSVDANRLWGRVRISTGTQDENNRFLDLLDRFDQSYGVIFDLDATLVDTSASFDQTVADLVERYSGRPLQPSELRSLRAEGGFNDDWVAAHELLRRRGVEISLAKVCEEALHHYLQIAREKESLLCDWRLLDKIGARHPLMIVTGRTRAEYEPIWADRLDPLFRRVYCYDDLPNKAPKPAPDLLLQAMSDFCLKSGVYIGNNVDDMHAARAAGLDAIGITTTLPGDILRRAGAQFTVTRLQELDEVYML